jgi:uncharacterized membrane protein
MSNSNKILRTAIAGVLALGTVVTTVDALAEPPGMEKCYGICKAHKNDCNTKTHSCTGSAYRDRQPDAYILVPQGICGKISGSSPISH